MNRAVTKFSLSGAQANELQRTLEVAGPDRMALAPVAARRGAARPVAESAVLGMTCNFASKAQCGRSTAAFISQLAAQQPLALQHVEIARYAADLPLAPLRHCALVPLGAPA